MLLKVAVYWLCKKERWRAACSLFPLLSLSLLTSFKRFRNKNKMSVFLLRRSLALSGSTSVELQGGFSGLETVIRVHVGKWVRSKFRGGSMHCGRRHLTKRLASYICSHLFSNQGNKNKIIQTSKTTLFQ